MIRLPRKGLRAIKAAGEGAYPFEACGLLVGRLGAGGVYDVTRVVPSGNVAIDATGRKDRFEIDPKLRFEIMRACEGTDDAIIGHYHSHPDHPAEPSRTDLAMAWDKEFVWVIVAVTKDGAGAVTAHIVAGDGFSAIPIELREAD
ncbi:MAG: hypothetical protein COA65_00605 [Rhodospirillaceae bacterium]|nr:MAG: hypothetical protein COA65_00605 [Rhodospirillaceae bacterium]